MQRIIGYILLSSFLLHTFSSLIINVDYQVNLERIVEEFCINKDKPELECNGKCHLAEQLANEEERKGEEEIRVLEVPCVNLSISHVSTVVSPVFVKKYSQIPYQNTYTFLLKRGVFHPPC